MTVKEIIKQYLIDNGFDGLCSEDCGCGVNDLICCNREFIEDCQPAYERTLTEQDDYENYDCEIGDTIYTTIKPTADNIGKKE